MPFIVKNTTYPSLADLLFPHSCRGCGLTGEALCECCKNNIVRNREDFKKSNMYVVSRRDGILNQLVQDYKYHSIRALARPLAELLDQVLPKNLPKNSIVVPLPTATNHIRNRGFDHTYLLAKNLGKIRKFKVEKILVRNKNTVQVGSTKKERFTQATKAYILNPKIKIQKDATYILLDDVYTTGASINAAKNLLKSAGAKNIKIALLAYSN
ncbi:MAG: ComF family protein [Candidatus Saccharibacteria bacterium]|nr:ComF family protein [Candidatus Saccharibacteria bacterium]